MQCSVHSWIACKHNGETSVVVLYSSRLEVVTKSLHERQGKTKSYFNLSKSLSLT